LVEPLEIEEQLATDRIDHSATAAKCESSAGANEARLQERIGHAGYCAHGDDRVANGSGRNVFFPQDTQGPQLAKILECVGLLRGNESGSLPSEQLVGTDLQDSQNILTAITGHSSMLHIRSDEDLSVGSRIGFRS
jgi:hypothetical protein